jgi:hypothetical protein
MDDERGEPDLRPTAPAEPPTIAAPPPPPAAQPPPPPPPPPPPSPVVGWAIPADAGRPTIDVASVVGRSFDTFGREWSLFLVLAAPAALGALLQVLIAGPGTAAASGTAAWPTVGEIVTYLATSLLSAGLSLVSAIAIAVAADALWQGRPIGVAGAFRGGLSAFPRYLAVVIVMGLMVGGVALIVAVVGVIVFAALGPIALVVAVLAGLVGALALAYLYARLALLAPVVVLERNGVIGSIVRSWDISRHHVIVLFLLTITISLCAALPLWGGSLFAGFVTNPLIAGIALAIATLVFEPLPAIAMVLAWGDRVGGRHGDSEVMARGRGRRVAAVLVFGLGAILLVAGIGVATQATATSLSLR